MAPIDLEMAMIVHEHITNKGVTLFLKDGVKAFLNQGKKVELASGKIIDADLIIFSIGVRPENMLIKQANLAVGSRGGIIVNEYLQTQDNHIYAIGDAIEVQDFVSHQATMIPLAGPVNKQARIVANNICGFQEKYQGTMGTSVAKVFDLVVGATGNNEKLLKQWNKPYDVVHIHPSSHAGYYPNATPISMKILYNPTTEEIYGAQAVGQEGVDKRMDVLATAIYAKMPVTKLKNLELSYAPPFSSAKDPVNMLGFVAENKLRKYIETYSIQEIDALIEKNAWILDVRDVVEFELGSIPHAHNIPLTELRTRIQEVPKDQEIYVFCQTGIRAYTSSRILMQAGYQVKNLDGGYKSYQCVYAPETNVGCTSEANEFGFIKMNQPPKEGLPDMKTIKVDACGLQCPGPIVQVYKNMQQLQDGDILEVKATDYGFLKDVKKWSEKTQNELLELTTEGNIITAKIRKGNQLPENKHLETRNDKENTTIVVFSQDLDKAIAAFIIATGAASMGKKVSLFFTFWGLNILRKSNQVHVKKTLIEKMFGFMMPRGVKKLPISNMNMLGMGPAMIKSIMKKKNVDSLPTLMKNAMEMGVKITACAMSMDIMGIKVEELMDGVEVAGVASYLAETTEANHNLFI
jgi:peroxiredoxin family protein/TusA-related sulfurtransferase/rhodanese-related sulfurtransferase